MDKNEFIFSNKLKCRQARHLAFWAVFFIQTIFINIPLNSANDLFKYQSYQQAVISSVAELPVCFFSVYIFLYFLFPLLQKKRYAAFFLAFISVLFFNCVLELFVHLILRPFTCPDCPDVTLLEKINMMENVGINVACFLGMLALGIKFTKHWYLQQVQNRLLARQKITNQLKLLKFRIQPEFLFQSLQALYYKISFDKKQAAEMLLRLSELLSYMLYESDNDFASVQRELFVIHEFIALKNSMQINKINFINNITTDLSKKNIPSFTLLPLIQNCAIVLQTDVHKEAEYFNLKLNADNNMLYCAMHIEVESATIKNLYAGIINNFKNRLEIVYKDNYKLEFSETAENKLSIILSLYLSDNLSVYKTQDASETRYVYAGE